MSTCRLLVYDYLGTEVVRSGRHLYCIDCGSRVPIKRALLHNWNWTACPSCENFTYHMIHGHSPGPPVLSWPARLWRDVGGWNFWGPNEQ